jgi:hypothetical protein
MEGPDSRYSPRSPAGAFRDLTTPRLFNSVTISALKRSNSRAVSDVTLMSLMAIMRRNEDRRPGKAQLLAAAPPDAPG